MIQQSHCWAYTLRKPEGKETRVPQCLHGGCPVPGVYQHRPHWSCASPTSSVCLAFLCPMSAGFFCLALCLKSLQQCLCPWPTCFGLFLWPCGVIRGDGQRVTKGRCFANGSSLSPPASPSSKTKKGGDLGDTVGPLQGLGAPRPWERSRALNSSIY